MRNDWEIKTLDDGFMKDSSNLSINKLKDDEGDYPFYSAKGFVKNISFYHQEKSYLAIIKDGAGVGRVSLHPAKSSVVGTLQYLLPKEGFDLKFLYYYLLSVDFSKYFTGSTIPHIYFKDYKSEPFPVVALNDQKEIVEILDKAFESIDKAKANIEKNIENAKELFKSMLNQIFFQAGEGWEQDIMVNLCDVLTCGVASTPKYVDESVGVPFLSAQNVKNGKVVLHKYRYISKEFHEHLTKKNKPTKGDILYTRVGAKFGEAAVVEHSFDFSVYVSLTLIRPNSEKLNNYYFKYYLNSPSIKSLAKSSITSSGVPNLNVKTVRDFPVFYPDLNKQKEIVETLDTIDNHIQSVLLAYNEELKNLEELKKSILQKAFNGELTNKNKAA